MAPINRTPRNVPPLRLEVSDSIRSFLLEKADQFEGSAFIEDDPIAIPHRYDAPKDIEIAGFLTAMLAWGNRKSILKSASRWLDRMGESPSDFLLHATHDQLEQAARGVVHRTFQERDAILFLVTLAELLKQYGSLEDVFVAGRDGPTWSQVSPMAVSIHHFQYTFFDVSEKLGWPAGRTRKHVADPQKGSAAKRLNMFLRWMVRPAGRGVDFGLWKQMDPAHLMIPLDVHTGNVGRKLGLLDRRANDWVAVESLTAALREVDAKDPVRLDFALFGLGAVEGF